MSLDYFIGAGISQAIGLVAGDRVAPVKLSLGVQKQPPVCDVMSE
jgi:hypothetical protein